MRVNANGRYFAVAGIGINVNHQADDFPFEIRDAATSLAMASGRLVNRMGFAVALLRKLENSYAEFASARPAIARPPA
jgi:BirA family biotin operon repressor/biotin-[acetyl-CoA-carboxylase] ligase